MQKNRYMATIRNPFVVTGNIPSEYFCGRIRESSRLTKCIVNGNNIVLISPRRMGKTGLIRFCYAAQEIRDSYYTFFIDILHTSSLREMTYLLGRQIYETLVPSSSKMALLFARTLKSINGKFGFDPFTGLPEFNLELGDIDRPELTLEEIFRYLAEADKPCIVAIDEFQQIAKYPEKNVEALLRSHIQKITDCNFIFAGSERHIMQEMFTSAARPFYNSADMMVLDVIAPEIYIQFVTGHFEKRGKRIDAANVQKVYDLFKGHTFYMQKIFNGAFSSTPDGEECTLKIIKDTIDEVLSSNEVIFREILSNIPEKQKALLYAIAAEGEATGLTSSGFVRRHSLPSSSAVQSAANKLLGKDIITVTNKTYSVTDKFFALWINTLYGKPYRLV